MFKSNSIVSKLNHVLLLSLQVIFKMKVIRKIDSNVQLWVENGSRYSRIIDLTRVSPSNKIVFSSHVIHILMICKFSSDGVNKDY